MTENTTTEFAPQGRPWAYLWQHSETGRTRIVMPGQVITADANWVVVGPLYLAAVPSAPAPQGEPSGEAAELAAVVQSDAKLLVFRREPTPTPARAAQQEGASNG